MELKSLQRKVDNWINEHGVRYFDPLTNMAQLTEEVGDVMCMVGLLLEHGLIDEDEIEERVKVKLAKLAKWSYLVEDTDEYKEIRNDDRRRNTKRGTRSRR